MAQPGLAHCVKGQRGLHREFPVSQGYRVRCCLKTFVIWSWWYIPIIQHIVGKGRRFRKRLKPASGADNTNSKENKKPKYFSQYNNSKLMLYIIPLVSCALLQVSIAAVKPRTENQVLEREGFDLYFHVHHWRKWGLMSSSGHWAWSTHMVLSQTCRQKLNT